MSEGGDPAKPGLLTVFHFHAYRLERGVELITPRDNLTETSPGERNKILHRFVISNDNKEKDINSKPW